MARIKGGMNAKRKHNKVLKLAKGYRGCIQSWSRLLCVEAFWQHHTFKPDQTYPENRGKKSAGDSKARYHRNQKNSAGEYKKAVRDLISISKEVAKTEEKMEKDPESMSREELEKLIGQVQKQMKAAAAELNFEMAAELRDKMITLKKSLDDMEE